MDRNQFERFVSEALGRIPRRFRDAMKNVAIVLEREPAAGLLAEMDIDDVVAIGETLIHEIGHYFGMSEEEIEAIEDRYWNNREIKN